MKVVQLLIVRGARKDAKTNSGKTAAQLAADGGHADVAALLQ
jgi:hypothetical protein